MNNTEIQLWADSAKSDLRASKILYNKKYYPQALYLLHQVYEKKCKIMLYEEKLTDKMPFGHSLGKIIDTVITNNKQNPELANKIASFIINYPKTFFSSEQIEFTKGKKDINLDTDKKIVTDYLSKGFPSLNLFHATLMSEYEKTIKELSISVNKNKILINRPNEEETIITIKNPPKKINPSKIATQIKQGALHQLKRNYRRVVLDYLGAILTNDQIYRYPERGKTPQNIFAKEHPLVKYYPQIYTSLNNI